MVSKLDLLLLWEMDLATFQQFVIVENEACHRVS